MVRFPVEKSRGGRGFKTLIRRPVLFFGGLDVKTFLNFKVIIDILGTEDLCALAVCSGTQTVDAENFGLRVSSPNNPVIVIKMLWGC